MRAFARTGLVAVVSHEQGAVGELHSPAVRGAAAGAEADAEIGGGHEGQGTLHRGVDAGQLPQAVRCAGATGLKRGNQSSTKLRGSVD